MPLKSSTRSWGTRFDHLPTSPSASPPACDSAVAPALSDSKLSQKKEDKMPHDASVFVGSLPSAIDQQELSLLLSEHLSEHTEVKNIKVIRDSKGGVCAFVQCEDAASAATLIHALHSNPPKPFLGRTLRYEPARAFRTLLVSYRTPVQYIPFNRETRSAGNDNPKAGQTIQLDLPDAMRVWKPRNSKFVSLLYNAEAVEAANHSSINQGVTSENASLFLQPVAYDAETIRKLATYFGRVESFDVYDKVDVESDNAERWKSYPSPHDYARSPGMDTGCWEIKWDHRDDCVSALMTLRRVPHLTVTWAHQPPPFGVEQRSPYFSHPPFSSPVYYPMHVQDRSQSLPHQYASAADLIRGNQSDSSHVGTTAEANSLSTATSRKTDDGNDNEDWITQATANLDVSAVSARASEEPTGTKWSDMDFPPLSTVKEPSKVEHGVWSEKMPSKHASPRSPPSTASQLASPEQEFLSFATLDGSLDGSFQSNSQEVQELEMPPNPGFGMSPITPKTPGSQFPITPTDDTSGSHVASFRAYTTKHGFHDDSDRTDRELDPTTLFVGGLETFGPNAWDEAKVEAFFAKFGGLESVKVVRPANLHAAFAFVKFDNTESPARAIAEEHNRVYDGRAMRVQLRECNPLRGPWRQNRGRGRFQPHFASHRRFPDNSDGRPTERPHSQQGHDHSDAVGTSLPVPRSSNDNKDSSEQSMDKNPKPEEENSDDYHGRNQSLDSRPSTSEPSFAPLKALSQSEGYREWYDEPISAALTPPPSTFSSSTSATIPPPALSYPIGSGYYAPPPWLHPYAQQMPYPIPYFPFPGYPMPSQPVPQVFPSLPGTDSTGGPGSVGAIPNSWPSAGMYGSFIPYSTQQPAQPPSTANMDSQHLNSRAPLAPTGFIQNEHGTLIAVYQPEALDRYMAGNNRVVPPPAPQHPVQTNWSFPPLHSYPFPVPPPLSSTPFPSSASMGWPANPGAIPSQAHHRIPPNISTPNPSAAFRGTYNDMGGQVGSPAYRRPPVRRDQGHLYNHGRNYQPRSFPGRQNRGNMNNTGYGEAHQRTPQNNGDWGHWSAGR